MDRDFHTRHMPGHYIPNSRRASVAYRAVKRFEHVARRMSTPDFSIDRLEQDLEKEIVEDAIEPKSLFEKFRKSGEEILHSKKVLSFIVVLNIIDCALVLSELILDIVFIKEMVYAGKELIYKFIHILTLRFPAIFGDLATTDVAKAFNRFLGASTTLVSASNKTVKLLHDKNCSRPIHLSEDEQPERSYFTGDEVPVFLDKHHSHTVAEVAAHALHKISITILGILVLFVLLKLFCYGLKFFKKKFELFDGIIVMTSFILDIAFIKGMMVYPLEDAVEILSFLIPWRVIRVANSLIAAVLDQAHLQLKTVYKEKKSCNEQLEFSQSKVLYHKSVVRALRGLCEERDIPPDVIKERIAMCGMPEPKPKKTTKGSLKNKFLSIYKSLPGGSNKSKVTFKDIRKETNGDGLPVGKQKVDESDRDCDTDSEVNDNDYGITDSDF